MSNRARSVNRVGLLLGLFAFVPLSGAQGHKEKGAATPEEAVKQVYANLQAGRVADALPYIAESERGFWAKYVRAAKAAEDYFDALDDKFGKDPAFRREFDLLERVKPHSPVEVREVKDAGKDKVKLVVWEKRTSPGTLERRLDAVKTETGWKLHLHAGGPNPAKREEHKTPDGKASVVWVEVESKTHTDERRAEVDFLLAEAAKQVEAVKAGKYKSRQEAFEEFRKRFREQALKEKR